ncbi:MAG: RNA-guided endonuclease TnpB family protein [Promethearchaeati archaeon SRVP18_Atabeyarchaeia-1]
MLVDRAYKTELDPNNVQKTLLLKSAGVARFAYNWGLARRKEEYEKTGKSSNAIELHRQLNALKRATFPWMYEVSKCAPQEALRDLDRAFRNFFEGRSRYPKFRSRRRGVGGFRLTGSITVARNSIQLPRIGRVRLKEKGYLPTDGVHILSAAVSEKAGRWFVSVQVDEEIEVPVNVGPTVGIDMGIPKLATISDGTTVENPRALLYYEGKKKRLQRSLSRKVKGSRNWADAQSRLARCEFRTACIRRDAQHKATAMLARTKSVVGVESLNVAGLMKNHCLAKQIADAGIGEFLRQLKYKAKWYGSVVVAADPFFPSTKRCSNCGAVKDEMPLSERTFRCERCGFEADRDLNAALNLAFVAASWAETLNACERREVHAAWQVPADEAGTERRLGGALNG